MTTAGNTDPVDRVPARIAWTASPSITLTYLADDDALLVDVLPGTSRAEVDRHGGLSIGLDGGDPLALPVCVCLVGFASTRGPAARLAREYLGEEIWRHATGLPTDADSDTWFVLTESAKTDALARWAAFAHREFGDVAGLRTLALPAAGKVRDVFISHAQEDRAVMTAFAEQLAEAGLDVFMDDTSRPRPDALASAKVFLAYSSATHPRLPAGLWSLLAAHRAAGAHGHRVLTVDPDTAPRGEVDLLHRVRESVALVDAPFGPTGDDVGADGFVGRLAELVRVHEALRDDGSVVLVRGADGIGKTSLVERYAALFRAVFPGGVHWTGPLGAGRDDAETLARYHAEVRRVAVALRIAVEGVERRRLRRLVADHFDALGRRVLWVVDDVPPDLAPETLDQLVIPSRHVCTVLTGRGVPGRWTWSTVDLDPLSTVDAELLAVHALPLPRAALDRSRHTARSRHAAIGTDTGSHDTGPAGHATGNPMSASTVHRAVPVRPRTTTTPRRKPFAGPTPHHPRFTPAPTVFDLAGGHALALTVAAAAVRVDPDAAAVAPAGDPRSLVDFLVAHVLARVGDGARTVLRLAALLDAAPLPEPLIVAVVDVVAPGTDVPDALDGLAVLRLARQSDGGWCVHPMVGAAVVRVDSPADLAAVARAAAAVLSRLLTTPDVVELWYHARALAAVDLVPDTGRAGLLRLVSRWHERIGEPGVAAAMLDDASAVVPHDPRDLVDAARVKIAAGAFEAAGADARRAVALAVDDRTRYVARALAARALDHLGHHPDAEPSAPGGPPTCLSTVDSFLAALAAAVSRRLRGRPVEGIALLAPVLERAPGEPAWRDRRAELRLELARLHLQAGQPATAHRLTEEVLADHAAAGLDLHDRCLEAKGLRAEATLALDLADVDPRPDHWEHRLDELHARYRRTLGEEDPLTLTAAVHRDRALVTLGKPGQALDTLIRTEELVARHLGEDHALRYRTRLVIGLACGRLRQFPRQRAILDGLLRRQVAALGAAHPDTLEAKVDLGIALAHTGDPTRARALVDDALSHLRDVLDLATDRRASFGQMLLQLFPKRVALFDQVLDRHRGETGWGHDSRHAP